MTNERYEQAQEIKRKEEAAKRQGEFWHRVEDWLYMQRQENINGYWVKNNSNEGFSLSVGEVRALCDYDKEQEEKYAKEFSEL